MNINRVRYKDIEQVPKLKINTNFKQQFQGSAPAPFIGRFGYPTVNIGILSPQFSGDMESYESPRLWQQQNTAISEIAAKRYSLVNSRTQRSVKDLHLGGNFLEIVQEVGLAKTAAEVEVTLSKPPQLNLKQESEIIPWGPASSLRKARITANTKVDSRVEKVVSDTDLKASKGILNLYNKGFEENILTKLISVGNLGLKKNRKLVPTRWSITAVDDTIGQELIQEIKNYSIGDYRIFFGGGWGNYYLFFFLPEVWGYELFELYLGQAVNPWSKCGVQYSTDYENYSGRKEYAEETAGGYYASRMPILEKMTELKHQGRVIAIRLILPEYNIPLGVWVCREAARKSLSSKSIQFADQESMFKWAKEFIQQKFSFDLESILVQSKLLQEKKDQKKLTEF